MCPHIPESLAHLTLGGGYIMTTTKPGAYTWTRKTYAAHAALICALTEDGKWQTITVQDLVTALGDMYQIDNPRFDRERFNKASMKESQHGS